jgi:hypothetical protein
MVPIPDACGDKSASEFLNEVSDVTQTKTSLPQKRVEKCIKQVDVSTVSTKPGAAFPLSTLKNKRLRNITEVKDIVISAIDSVKQEVEQALKTPA